MLHLSSFVRNALVLLIGLVVYVEAHSIMTWPRPTTTRYCHKGNGDNYTTVETCPEPTWPAVNFIDPDMPTVALGQVMRVRCQKNNHRGGFARFAVVPLRRGREKKAFATLPVLSTCFYDNKRSYNCSSEKDATPLPANAVSGHGEGQEGAEFGACGTDTTETASYVDLFIPPQYATGIYFMQYQWWGGLTSSGLSFFGRYSSCAYFKIEGGAALSTRPYFAPFEGNPEKEGQCDAARGVTTPRGCNNGTEPCTGLTEAFERPAEYSDGKTPSPVSPASIAGNPDEDVEDEPDVSSEEEAESPSNLAPAPVPQERKKASTRLISGLSVVDTRTLTATPVPLSWQSSAVVIVDAKNYPTGWTLRVDPVTSVADRVSFVTFAFWGDVYRKESFTHETHAPVLAMGNKGIEYNKWNVPVGGFREFQVTMVDVDGARDSHTLSLVVI